MITRLYAGRIRVLIHSPSIARQDIKGIEYVVVRNDEVEFYF